VWKKWGDLDHPYRFDEDASPLNPTPKLKTAAGSSPAAVRGHNV
jgi:hypothetical protein